MPQNRFFKNQLFQAQETVFLTGKELGHLKVMRVSQSSSLELVNGRHQLATASLLELNKDKAVLKINKVMETPRPPVKIILALSLLKPAKMDLAVEKATELGIHEFVFFPAQNSEIKTLSSNKQQRLQAVCIAALKQCGRLDLPKICFCKNLENTAEYLTPSVKKYFGEPDLKALSAAKLLKNRPEELKSTDCVCFIGPEKGFTAEEIFFLKKQLKATGISLSSNILRAETAAIAAASFLFYCISED